MNYLDIIIGIILIAGAIKGFVKGFVYEIAVLGALFLGIYAAFKFSYIITPWLSKTSGVGIDTVRYVSGFVMFLLVVIGIIFLAKLFTSLANMAALGIFNKIAGAIFGLLKHGLLLSIGLYFFNQLDTKHHYLDTDKKADSALYYQLLKIAPAVLPIVRDLKIEIIEEVKGMRK
jgi:membrane protein required for colicin V production